MRVGSGRLVFDYIRAKDNYLFKGFIGYELT